MAVERNENCKINFENLYVGTRHEARSFCK